MAEALRKPGHVCTIVHDLTAAEDELRHGSFDVVVTDLVMDNETAGLKVLELARQHQDDAETLVVTAHGDVPTAKAALQGGAYDFIEKPLDLEVFRNLVNRAAETVLLRHQNLHLRDQVDAAYGFEGIIGESVAIRKVVATIKQVAPSDIAVLVTGGKRTSGTSRSMRLRRARPCWRISCSATSGGPSPAPTATATVSSSTPTAARCFSTRSGTCRCPCRRSCCECSRPARS
jgi:DNA-binding NtrC family response regulator